jgi:GNAT superfamily N-acetyltransferase
MQVLRLTAGDFEDAMDFLNMVFSQAHEPHDFAALLPWLYRPVDECMRWNMAVRENGKIRAIVGLYPMTLYAGDVALKAGGIGAVSSHPNDRGKGWMRLLMNRCVEEMREEGYDLSCLGGMRQRYRHFGYEKAGMQLVFSVGKSCFSRIGEAGTESGIRFEPMLSSDAQRILKAKELHDAGPVRFLRAPEEFHPHLASWYMQPWAAIRADGSMAGYLAANRKQDGISEIFAQDEGALADMVRAWFERQDAPDATISIQPWEREKARFLGGIAEAVRMTDGGSWQIFDWPKVVGAFLRVKSKLQRLADGAMCVGIEGYGNIRIEVGGGAVSCAKASARPDVEWDAFTAVRALFGQIPPNYVAGMPGSVEPLAASWFPLPLGWPVQDHV